MAIEKLLVTDPKDGRYIELVQAACEKTSPTMFKAAVAYATQSGVAELCDELGKLSGWKAARKQWLIGIDFCRSDPSALTYLDSLPKSGVRIFDGALVAGRSSCVPKTSYHPKMYLFQGKKKSAAVVGSGNLSYTGLRMGVEAGASIIDSDPKRIAEVKTWFSRQWRRATPLDDIAELYAKRYASLENRRSPVASEDDTAPESAGRHGQLTPAQLRQIRVCQHFWIEAGNLHKNRGPGRPGNQLMLKRNSRVFFGFPALDLTTDTTIGDVAIQYAGYLRPDCSLRFSNNSMDVLTLPVPDTEGPHSYDQETLHFERVGLRQFKLSIGRRADVGKWKRSSDDINGTFRMSSGRQWGVY